MDLSNDTVKHTALEGDTKAPRKTDDEEDMERESKQYREISQARNSYWIEDFGKDEVVKFPTTGTTWKPGNIFSEREMRDCRIPEASALCVATQVEGPSLGSEAMLRIRQQIPKGVLDPDDIDRHENYPGKEPLEVGDYAEMELDYLLRLTDAGCSCTPKVIDHRLEAQGEADIVPGGFRLYLLMEKIPGRNLVNFGELDMEERDQVRIAFAKAIYEFYKFGLSHEDRHRRNLMWDRKNKKVYIIDLEAATHYRVKQPSLAREFYNWGLAGVSMDAREGGVDPMVPDRDAFDNRPYPSEKELVEMAAAAAGKPTRPKTYPRKARARMLGPPGTENA